ncbi:MAG: hypothetical protein AAGA67_02125 [Cyanobacteria bacterium P01_F01_bin.153]
MKYLPTPDGDIINTDGMSLVIVEAGASTKPQFVILAIIPASPHPLPVAAYWSRDAAMAVNERILGAINSGWQPGCFDDLLLEKHLSMDEFHSIPWGKVGSIPAPGEKR